MTVLLADGEALVRHLVLDAVVEVAIVIGAAGAVVLGAVLIVRRADRDLAHPGLRGDEHDDPGPRPSSSASAESSGD